MLVSRIIGCLSFGICANIFVRYYSHTSCVKCWIMLLIIRPAGIQKELVIREFLIYPVLKKECHSSGTEILNQKRERDQKEIIVLKNLISILPKEIVKIIIGAFQKESRKNGDGLDK